MGHTTFATAFGTAGLAWEHASICSFSLPDQNGAGVESVLSRGGGLGDAELIPDWVALLIERVRAHFEGRLQDFADVSLEWTRVSEFQCCVYRHTQTVKPGSTCSYGDIARALGLPPASARAVGLALGSNPWPLLVPCHRVIAADGKMTGFSAPGGVGTKVRLLALEGAELALG